MFCRGTWYTFVCQTASMCLKCSPWTSEVNKDWTYTDKDQAYKDLDKDKDRLARTKTRTETWLTRTRTSTIKFGP